MGGRRRALASLGLAAAAAAGVGAAESDWWDAGDNSWKPTSRGSGRGAPPPPPPYNRGDDFDQQYTSPAAYEGAPPQYADFEDDWGDFAPSAPPPPPPPASRRGRRQQPRRPARFYDAGDFFEEKEDADVEYEAPDMVLVYSQSAKGKAIVTVGSGLVGAAIGVAISESTVHKTPSMALAGLFLGLMLSIARGAFGDLLRALGLGAYLTVVRSASIGSKYPILPQLKAAMHMGPRRPFPPVPIGESPSRYRPVPGGPEFSTMKALLAMAFMGGMAGYFGSKPVPLLPEVLGALATAGCAAYATTLRTSAGDLARLGGMRFAALLGVVTGVDAEVRAWDKARVVGRLCFAKLAFWDKKYQVTRKATEIVSTAVAKAKSSTAQGRGGADEGGAFSEDGGYEGGGRRRRGPPGGQRQEDLW